MTHQDLNEIKQVVSIAIDTKIDKAFKGIDLEFKGINKKLDKIEETLSCHEKTISELLEKFE